MTENETNLSTGWKDGKIVPSVMYQVYGMNAFYGPYEDEKNAYTFTPGIKSTSYTWAEQSGFTPETGVTYREVEAAPTTATVGELDEIVVLKGTPDVYYKCTTITNTPNAVSTIVITKGGETYTGELVSSDTITATITASSDLAALHPQALVSIDGKEYTLGVLANPITLHMNRDHRISINWIHNELVETFLIVAKR
jgi:hypothetical protein